MKPFLYAAALACLAAVRASAAVVEFAPVRASFVSQFVAFRPEAAAGLGAPGLNDKLSIPTPSNIAAQIAFFESAERQFAKVHPHDAQEEMDRQVMLAVARSQVRDLKERKSYLTDVAAAQAPRDVILAQAGAKTGEEWSGIIGRAELVPEHLKAVRANLERGVGEGRQVYRGFVEQDGIEAAESAADFFGTTLSQKAREQLSPVDFEALKPRLDAAGASAKKAYLAHAEFLRAEILPAATERYGVGAAEYAWKLKNELGVRESPAELQRKGREIAERLTVRMTELAKELAPDKSLPELMAELRDAPPRNDEEPGAHASRKGALLPAAGAAAREDFPVRHLLDHAGFAASLNTDGYARYAEELTAARGFRTPKEELIQLGAQLWGAWRVSLDAALHTGAVTMDEAARTLTEKAFLPEAIAKGEPHLYARMPTQALTPLLGRLQIEELKSAYEKRTGSGYSETEFHRAFLSYGPVPPRLIAPALLEAARPGSAFKRFWRNPVATVLASIAAAGLFNAGVYIWMGAQSAQEFMSTYLIEWTLSLDNLVVLSTALHALPREVRPKVLGWGILGAVLMRFAMVLAGMGIAAANPGLFVVFGAFLLTVAVKMLNPKWDPIGRLFGLVKSSLKPLAARGARGKSGIFSNPFVLGLMTVIGYDIIFALDSVPAALAITSSVFIIVAANFFSVLGLRSLFKVLDKLEERFPHLQKGVGAVLFFVAAKMILGPTIGLHVGSLVSLLVVLAALGVSMLIPARKR